MKWGFCCCCACLAIEHLAVYSATTNLSSSRGFGLPPSSRIRIDPGPSCNRGGGFFLHFRLSVRLCFRRLRRFNLREIGLSLGFKRGVGVSLREGRGPSRVRLQIILSAHTTYRLPNRPHHPLLPVATFVLAAAAFSASVLAAAAAAAVNFALSSASKSAFAFAAASSSALAWSIVTAATTFSSEFYHRLRSQILCLVPVSATVEGRLNHGYVSGCADGAIRLWLRGGSSSIVVGRHNDEVSCICMAGTGRVVTGSCDSSVRLWSIPSDDTVSCAIHTHHVGAVLSIIYLGGPLDLVASGSWDCSVVVWSIKHKRLLHAFIGHESSVICLAATVLYGQVLLLSGSADATLQVWDLGPGCNAGELLGHTGSVECIDTLGDCVVTGSADHTVRLWSLEHRVCTRVLLGHTGYVTGVR